MPRKNKISDINLVIDSIKTNNQVIRINWSSDIGYGSYDIEFLDDGSIVGHSETMDSNEDKYFLKKLLSLIEEKIIIK